MARLEKFGLVIRFALAPLARRMPLLSVLAAIVLFLGFAILSKGMLGMVDRRVYPILGSYVIVMLLLLVYLIVTRCWAARSAALRRGLTLSEYIREVSGDQQ